MRPRPQAAVQLARPLGRALPQPLSTRLGVVPKGSIIQEMLAAEEAQRAKCFDFKKPERPAAKPSTPTSRPASPPSLGAVPDVARPEAPTDVPTPPTTQKTCERAVMLLGYFIAGTLTAKERRRELVKLIGGLPPDLDTAKTWKSTLKKLRPTLPA